MMKAGRPPGRPRLLGSPRRGRSNRRRPRVAEFFGDAEQLVVLRVAIASAGSAGLDLAAVRGDRDVGDGRVLGLARAVAEHARVAVAASRD